ncbi:replication initiation protein RepC [Rhizobium petrolearium]|uniref:Plasmid replication protein RepC n=2 Tax=Neorhizobium TaxID=1525371 RepID=A0ABV0MFJ8_9HYPH|nr:plasmid replication protein RepC [Neorhizobium petrolearium]MBP1848324.1 replication initiation protein RepC [Neorhizobium petrolearium]MCC2614544.1 replication protein C [Neorhizobium petrolearium]WGI72303.1 plasmid replication protein RepC [Neorhizobium petrolearium]
MGNAIDDLRPAGRRITPLRAEFSRRARSTEVGSVTRAQLSMLAQTLTCTGLINGSESHLLVALINTAPAEAFDKSGIPIVFKSNRQLAFEIGRSAGRVSRMLSRLFDVGLITMQDSGNYKRYPVRNGEGEITDGCGIDLRILIARYAELDQWVKKARVEKKAVDAALRRYRGALRTARHAIVAATGLPEMVLQTIGRRIERLTKFVGLAPKATSETLRRATVLLDWLVDRLMRIPRRVLDPASEPGKMTCPNAVNDMHRQNTTPHQSAFSNEKRRSASAEQPRLQDAGSADEWAFEESLKQPSDQVNDLRNQPQDAVALRDLLAAAPTLREFGYSPTRWAELTRLTPILCRFAGISDDARRRAVESMGERQAAVAVAITLEKTNRHEVTSPGGYLRAMTARAATGRLHLARSVFGLAARHRSWSSP